MEPKQDNAAACKVELKEFTVEIDKSGIIPQWFQESFGRLINTMISDNMLELTQHDSNNENQEKIQTASDNTDNSEEYVNWEETPEENNYKLSGTIRYQKGGRVSIHVYISKGDSIKFSNSYSSQVDDVIESTPEILLQVRNFVLLRCGKESIEKLTFDASKYHSDAIKLLENEQEDKSLEKHFITGLFFAKAGNEEKALENLDYVISSSTNPDIVQNCYKVVLEVKAKKNMKDLDNAQKEVYEGDPGKAIPLIESLIQITPNYIHLHFLLGIAYKRNGLREKAVEAFRRALEQDTNHVATLRELAEELVASGNLAEAESMYRRIIGLNQANATDYYNLGMCLKRMGRKDELDEIIQRIKELDTEGRLDSYLFNLFEFRAEHFPDSEQVDKKSIWSRLFGKK